MHIDDSACFALTQRVGDVSLSHTIYLKDRKVVVTETVGALTSDSEMSYDHLPQAVLKAYQAWITNIQV